MTACVGDNRVNETLQTADRLIFVAQDSAVIMLDNLDLDHASRAQRARHALLLTKAREKANITVTDDSLIAIAADYYRGCGDSLEVQSLFYHGVILGYRDDYPRALLSLIQAADLADAIGDDFYRAMACREQVGVYTKLYEFDGFLASARKPSEPSIALAAPSMPPGSESLSLSRCSIRAILMPPATPSPSLPPIALSSLTHICARSSSISLPTFTLRSTISSSQSPTLTPI